MDSIIHVHVSFIMYYCFPDISAYPSSVNVLGGISNDVRTPDKLIDGVISSDDSSHMWLSPILPITINTVYIIFDVPQVVSGIKLWNYGKTPSRGVKEFSVSELYCYMCMYTLVQHVHVQCVSKIATACIVTSTLGHSLLLSIVICVML